MDLHDIYAPVSKELDLIGNELIKQVSRYESLAGSPALYNRFIKKALSHLFQSKGKQLRSALVMLSAKSVLNGGFKDRERFIKLGTAVELIHSASLVHDDVIDGSQTRRNLAAVHEVFGNKIAILIGDVLFSKSFTLLAGLDIKDHALHTKILTLFGEITQTMCVGEIREARLRQSHNSPRKSEYFSIIKNKTAHLMSASCYAGALLAQASQETGTALKDYGNYFGLAYQLADDFEDGDSLYASRDKLSGEIRQYVTKSHHSLRVLQDSRAKESLLQLSGILLQKL